MVRHFDHSRVISKFLRMQSLFGVAHEAPLALEEPVEVLRPRVRVVPQEQLQDEGPDNGGGVDAVAGEGAYPFRPTPLVVFGQFLEQLINLSIMYNKIHLMDHHQGC